MVKRLIVGLVLGLIVGGLAAGVLIKGAGMVAFGVAALAYLAAAATGALTGLVAGKPIWSADGKIEAGLKAVFGGLLAAGGMFALRAWATGMSVDLTAIGAGSGSIGDLPAVTLPLLAGLLGSVFELDNTGEPEASAPAAKAGVTGAAADAASARGAAKRGAARSNVRVAEIDDDIESNESAAQTRKKR